MNYTVTKASFADVATSSKHAVDSSESVEPDWLVESHDEVRRKPLQMHKCLNTTSTMCLLQVNIIHSTLFETKCISVGPQKVFW